MATPPCLHGLLFGLNRRWLILHMNPMTCSTVAFLFLIIAKSNITNNHCDFEKMQTAEFNQENNLKWNWHENIFISDPDTTQIFWWKCLQDGLIFSNSIIYRMGGENCQDHSTNSHRIIRKIFSMIFKLMPNKFIELQLSAATPLT